MKKIYTIGHSTHTLEEFTEMLQSFKIQHLVDVRGLPGSNKYPQFNYADYMETPDFEKGIAELVAIAERETTAYMCAEALWWRCHRSMISDYLKAKGWQVDHIMAIGKDEPHKYTAPARIMGDKVVYYDEGAILGL